MLLGALYDLAPVLFKATQKDPREFHWSAMSPQEVPKTHHAVFFRTTALDKKTTGGRTLSKYEGIMGGYPPSSSQCMFGPEGFQQIGPRRALGGPLGNLGIVLEPYGTLLGASWGCLRPSWGHLGGFLGANQGSLGLS